MSYTVLTENLSYSEIRAALFLILLGVIAWGIRNHDATIGDRVGLEVHGFVKATALGLLEEPAEVVPELGFVADRLGNHMCHFMDSDEDHDVFRDEGFAAAAALP